MKDRWKYTVPMLGLIWALEDNADNTSWKVSIFAHIIYWILFWTAFILFGR